MKRSSCPARFAVFRQQFSAPASIGGRNPVTRHSSHATCHGVRRADAFTLMELMAVVAIIAIIAGLTLGTLGYVNRKGAESRAKAEVATISAAIDSYKLDFGSYPPTNTSTLYRELTGQGTVNKAKVFIEPTPSMVTNTTNGPFMDPWGTPYNYSTNPSTIVNTGFFDFWTTAGGKTNQAEWIRN